MTQTAFELRCDSNDSNMHPRLFGRSLLATASFLALMFVLPCTAIAETAPTSTPRAATAGPQAAATEANTAQREQTQIEEKRKQITAEAVAAIRETQNALKALDEGEKKDALSALERATGKLELILAREPKLALAPTNVSAVTTSIVADTQKVKEVRTEAGRLLNNGRVQDARHLLEALASETVINVSNIPLATYPAAIKEAVKLIDNGKENDAKAVLQTALNTLVITRMAIPLPIVEAQVLLLDAEKLGEKANRTPEENTQLDALLAQARARLEFAQALGYGATQDFANLYVQLASIKDKTSGSRSGNGFFDAIKTSLSTLVNSVQAAGATQPAAVGKVNISK